MKKIMLPGMACLLLLSCNQPGKEAVGNDVPLSKDIRDLPVTSAVNDLYSDGIGKIIKTADFRFQVGDVKKSQGIIEASVRKYYGYIATSSLEMENPVLEEHITIRVLSDYFEVLLKEIDGQAQFINRRKITTDDASKEFVDLESRLRTKREVEQRYMDILRKKAGTIEELLKAEQQIGALHEEIEATISRVNFLRDQVRYSTINLEFYQTISLPMATTNAGGGLGEKFARAFTSGFSGMVDLFVALTYLWPLVVAGVILIILWKRKRMRLAKVS